MRSPAVTLMIFALVACAGRSPRPGTCPGVPEAEWIDGRPVYRDCSVDRVARPTGTTPRIQYTPTGRQTCARAIVDVVVDTSGRTIPTTARTVRSTDPGLLQALIASLDGRRYEPARRDGRSVPQIVRVDVAVATQTVIVSADAPPPLPRAPRRAPC